MKQKIIDHFKTKYQSSPVEIGEEGIKRLIEHECECDYCGQSIFEIDDYPVISVGRDEVICEDCYDEHHRTVCPLCEEHIDNDDMSEYFFISKEISREVHKEMGMYKILRYPFYYGDCVTGFDDFFDSAIEKVSNIDIKECLSVKYSTGKYDVLLDRVCDNCAETYLGKDNFIKAEPATCVLMKKYRDDYKKYTEKQLHSIRWNMIHRRITFRGIIEHANCVKK
ncbi:MAG: hypothetical protein LBQ73_07170 [Tannerellaceae bacterium]|nr:hypothetical protein [Tannerellaceae bacterium]